MTSARKLRDAREAIEDMQRAPNSDAARRAFARAAADLKSAAETMGAEAKRRLQGRRNAKALRARVDEWIASKSPEEHELLRWVFDARNEDLHATGADARLGVGGSTHVRDLFIAEVPEDGYMELGVEGPVMHRQVNTPEEYVEMVPGDWINEGWHLFAVNPPVSHRGVDLPMISDPVELLKIAYRALRSDWDEAQQLVPQG